MTDWAQGRPAIRLAHAQGKLTDTVNGFICYAFIKGEDVYLDTYMPVIRKRRSWDMLYE